MRSSKSHVEIRDPLYGRIRMSDVQHVLHSPPLQRMAQIKQLGGAYFVFPGATHTRLAHMLGVAHLTRKRVSELVADGELTSREALELVIAALCHDVGHLSFSHLVESMCGSHDKRGLEIILGELAPFIEECGASPMAIAAIEQRTTTLSEIIFTNPIGTDKLDYLARDAYYAYGSWPSFEDLEISHVRWNREVGLYVLPKGWPLIVQAINWSWFMYVEIYERISTRIGQRSVQEVLRQMVNLDETIKQQLYEGGEDGVMGSIAMWCAKNPEHECAERLQRIHRRDYPKKALIYSPHPGVCPLRPKATMAVLECDSSLLINTERWSVDRMAMAEQQIAEVLGVAPEDVSVAVAPPARRWKVPEVKVQVGSEFKQIVELAPEMAAMSQLYSRMACTVAVAVDKEIRPRVVADKGLHHTIRKILEEE